MSRRSKAFLGIAGIAGAFVFPASPAAQVGTVDAEQKISETAGGLGGVLDLNDEFGVALASIGDLDGDGNPEIAVGVFGDDDGGNNHGAVWVLFLNADGTIHGEQKISETSGGFGGVLGPLASFGRCVASLGDLDGDGSADLATAEQSAVWILFLAADGTVEAERALRGTDLGIPVFGVFSLASLGDLDGDGHIELAAGVPSDFDGGSVWILSLNTDGTVRAKQKISATSGGFGGHLDFGDMFGSAITSPGDINGDGTRDLAVGTSNDDDGGTDQGAIWILFLNADGTVKSEQKISATEGGFGGDLDANDNLGDAIASAGDLDLDGVPDLAAGVHLDDDGGEAQGAVWMFFLKADGTVKSTRKISGISGGFGGDLDPGDFFGDSLGFVGDLDGDGDTDLAVGASRDDDGGANQQGAVWVLFLEGAPECRTLGFDSFVNGQHLDVEFGTSLAITSSGPNAGAGIFDSTVVGPNDPSQDPDLLVDTGNLLILQTENLPPDAGDVFPRPNDDADGGTLSFAFPEPIEPRSVRLVDIDAGTSSSVVLSDSSGRRRTYAVPSGWTGDRTLSQPGQRTLDLSTLAPQPGFASVATASEETGFDARAVVRIDVALGGSGGVDDLAWCAAGSSAAHASATVRNGSGVNPLSLSSTTLPVLGGTWVARVDCTGHGSGFSILTVASSRLRTPSAFGELLVGGPRHLLGTRPHLGAAVSFAEPLPNDASLFGLLAFSQGACTGGGVSLTNALDLVLGF